MKGYKQNLRYLVIFLPLMAATASFAQKAIQQRDTSFTLNTTFIKEQKKRPYITIASPKLNSNVLIRKDVVFRTIGDRQLLLDVYYPKNKHKLKPSVLLIFGGGWKSGNGNRISK
jgi:carboxylesterase type B